MASADEEERMGRSRRRRRFVIVWAFSSLVFFLLSLTFILSEPLGVGPDEPAQVIKAASTVRGQVVGPSRPHHGGTATTVVRVPLTFADLQRVPRCVDYHLGHGAGCAPPLTVSWREATTTTYVGRYPPLYYLVVGLPSLLSDGAVSVYLMRVVSALLSCPLLGLALAMAVRWSRHRLLGVGVALAATPTTIYLAGSINPNGLEIAAAIAAWTGGLVLVRERAGDPPPALVVAVAASAGVMAVTEALALPWLAVLALTLVASDPGAARRLGRHRGARGAAVGVGVVAVVAAGYDLAAKAYRIAPFGLPVAPGSPWTHVVDVVWRRSSTVLAQSVGSFGQPDTFAPVYLWLPWLGLLLAGAVVGLVLLARAGDRRGSLCLVGLVLACALLPAVIMASHARVDGVDWQARDGMPIYVGIPLLLAAGLDDRDRVAASTARVLRAVRVVAATLVSAGVLVALERVLRRYTVGLGRTVDPLSRVPGRWDPPVPTGLLLAVAVALSLLYGAWLLRATSRTVRHGP